jgi:16S rRNA (guanine(966)-N(2))-methyltransferase RsmD
MTRQRGPTVRIFAGQWKRRHLEVPEGARPTSGRAREALFSILQKRVPGARVLDLYAGSGAVGIEAISRGADRAVLVEKDAAVLRRNLAKLPPAEGEIEVLEEDAEAALARLASRGVRFDLVFSDPPYSPRSPVSDPRAGVAGVLAPEGIFIFQTDRFEGAPPDSRDLYLLDRREYGRNVFFFFARDPGVRLSGRALSL